MGYMYASSWKLLIIGLLSEYFAILLKILHLKKLAWKCFTFFHWLYVFLMGRSRVFFWIRIKFHQGRAKEGVRWGTGKKPKMRVIFEKFPLLNKIQTSSHKLLVRQTSNHHDCNWHAHKPTYGEFLVISSSSSWSKTTLCIFKEEIWLPNRKCHGKNKLFWFSQQEALCPFLSQHLVQVINFQVIWSSSSWSKTTLCIFMEQIWLPNGKCNGKK